VGLRISFFERKGEFMDTGNQFLGTERIEKLMRQYAIPCIISLLVGAVINIILDSFLFSASAGARRARLWPRSSVRWQRQFWRFGIC